MTNEELKAIEERANLGPGDTPFAMIEGLLTGVLSDRPKVLDHCRSTIEYARERSDAERADARALIAEVRRLRLVLDYVSNIGGERLLVEDAMREIESGRFAGYDPDKHEYET